MRYVIYGAGAVGGTIGGRLFQHGRDVVLLARGAHLGALQADGLTLRDPDGVATLPVPAAGSPAAATLRRGDAIVLAMKTQDTPGALDALESAVDAAELARGDIAVVCAQNGVENERLALRRFPNVYAMCVMLPATHLVPGTVDTHSAPISGILDLGRYPSGSDATAEATAADLSASGFSSNAEPSVMRSKYAKLLMNLGNSLEAAAGLRTGDAAELFDGARAEGRACLAAAGIDVASEDEDRARRGDLLRLRPIEGARRDGGSSWQSLARGSGAIEADWLNGEIVLLGRSFGVPTPINASLQRVANRMARDRRAPGSMTVDEIRAEIAASR